MNKCLSFLIISAFLGIKLAAYTPQGFPVYLKTVTNNAGSTQDGYYILTSDIPLFEPSDRDSSIICQVAPESYYTPLELNLNPKTPKNLTDIIPILNCDLTGQNCSTDTTICNKVGGVATSCSYKGDDLMTVPPKGKSIDFYSAANSVYEISAKRSDPTVFYSDNYPESSRPKTLIFVPKNIFATDPIIMVGRDSNWNFYTAAFSLSYNIGETNDAVYFPVDIAAALTRYYINITTDQYNKPSGGAELTLEIKPVTRTIEGETTPNTYDYAPVLSSGTQTTETQQTEAIEITG